MDKMKFWGCFNLCVGVLLLMFHILQLFEVTYVFLRNEKLIYRGINENIMGVFWFVCNISDSVSL